jgi:hypothetical protein
VTTQGHKLSRCLFSEMNMVYKLGWGDVDDHVDQICEQLCFDALGYGINGRMK